MKWINIAALAVLLCCHVLLVQSSDSQRGARQGNKNGKISAKKEKSSAKKDVAPPFLVVDSAAASQEVPTHATDSTDVKPIVMSALFDDQRSAGDLSNVTQTPLVTPSKGKGSKTRGGKKKGKNSKPVNANEKGGAKSKNKRKPGARKPNRNNSKTGKGKSN